MEEIRTKLSPPWITYMNMIKALFDPDPEIEVVYADNYKSVYLYVDNADKAAVLDYLLSKEVWFGGVDLKINVVPSNKEVPIVDLEASAKVLIDTMFYGNPVFAYCTEVKDFFGMSSTYVVFKNKVVQFFNDNLADLHGIISILYEDIAREIFEDADLDCVYFNTDIEEKINAPKEKWL